MARDNNINLIKSVKECQVPVIFKDNMLYNFFTKLKMQKSRELIKFLSKNIVRMGSCFHVCLMVQIKVLKNILGTDSTRSSFFDFSTSSAFYILKQVNLDPSHPNYCDKVTPTMVARFGFNKNGNNQMWRCYSAVKSTKTEAACISNDKSFTRDGCSDPDPSQPYCNREFAILARVFRIFCKLKFQISTKISIFDDIIDF